MKIAINKNCISKIKDLKEHEYIYIFDDEDIKDLIKLNLYCIKYNYVDNIDVDINLTNYDIECLKKASIYDDDWQDLPLKQDYKFAIIIPNYNNDHGDYNGKTFLQNCIESVLNQTYKNYELIIVDDMSTDTSVKTVEKYVDKRIHLIKNNRKRYNGGSRNVGIDYAKTTDCDYICFLDSDDWWKNENVLENINKKLYGHEMLIYGAEMLFPNGRIDKQTNKFETYQDVYFCLNKVWCTAWSRVIRIDKIVYFCEDTLMEDRVWSYRQADNCNFEKIVHLNKVCYVWNRLNTTNSVSMSGSGFWKASAWCHIGHQLQFMETMKHKEMQNILKSRIDVCIRKATSGKYQQY